MCEAQRDGQSTASDGPAAEGELAYTVFGMGCGGCKAKVTQAVSDVAGVEDLHVDLDQLRLTVRGSRLDDQAIRAAVTQAGYELEPVS